METTPAFRGLACTDCGATHGADEHGRCPGCGGPLDSTYDLDAVALGDDGGGRSMWRFGSLLPVVDPVTVAEGGTPLVASPALAEELGVGDLRVKDESRNPTGSFVDRGMSVAMTAARERGREPLALAAAGNAAQSAATYAGVADLRSRSFVPARAPFATKAMTNVHGGEMHVGGGRYPDADAALDDRLATDYHDLRPFTTPYRHEGAKTIAHEIAADAGTVPDVVVVPVGTGEALVGVEKGFRERIALGLADEMPRLVAAQPSGCAPVATAHERGTAVDPPEHPDTICGELEIPDPPGSDLALRALDRTDGRAVAVDDDDLLESAVAVTKTTGVEVGLAGGAAAAAAWAVAGDLPADATVVVLNTESGGKTPDVLRSHLMGQGV